MTISQSTIKKLWGSSQKCTICQIDLITYSSDGTPSVLGEMAHIHGENPQSMRYDATLPDDFVNSAANLILLCPNCHTQIDKKENQIDYPPEKLYELKWNETMSQYLEMFRKNVDDAILWADHECLTPKNSHLLDEQIDFVLNKYTQYLCYMKIPEHFIENFKRNCRQMYEQKKFSFEPFYDDDE